MNFRKWRYPAFICAGLLMFFTISSHADPKQIGAVVKMFGTGTAGIVSEKSLKGIESTGIDVSGLTCFELPGLDPVSGRKLAVVVDCIRPINTDGDLKGEGLQVEAYNFFFFHNGTVVNHDCNSVRPFFEGTGDAGVTHMTGSIPPSEFNKATGVNGPEACTVNQGIIYGAGAYKNVVGDARLSGAVNLSKFSEGTITFSCLYVLNLALKKEGIVD